MITERLRSVMDNAAAQLSAEQQDLLAEQIEVILDDALWDAQLDDPQYDHVLEKMVARAKQQPPLPLPTPKDMVDRE